MKKTKALLYALGLAGLTGLPGLAAPVETPGFLKYDTWFSWLRDTNLVGTVVDIVKMDPNYPNTPDMTSYIAGMDSRSVFPDDTHDQYSSLATGWFTPVVTDDYNFYIRSDDASELNISSDSTTANLLQAAYEPGCCSPFQEPNAGTQTTAAPIHMIGGQKYAIQILFKEGTGNDYVQVAVQSATTGTTPAASLLPFQSTMVSCMADPAGASLTILQQPVATSTPENAAVTFTIASTAVTPASKYTGGTGPTNSLATALGTKSQIATFYQWFTNGVEVAGANATSYTIPWPKKAQNGMKVKCYVAVPGIPLYSSEVALTVTDDTTPPTVVKVTPDFSFTSLLVKYSEPVGDTALAASTYTISGGVTVSSVARVDLQTVKLMTSKMPDSQIFTLTITGVQDTATPPNSIAANTQIQFRSFVFMAGTMLHKKYGNVSDGAGWPLANLFNDPRYPNTPDRLDLESTWEYPPGGVARVSADDDPANPGTHLHNYFDTIEGFFIPATSGNYVFFTCGADRIQLYLSTDDTPANAHMITQLNGWTNPRNWITGQSTDMTPARSDTFSGTAWPGGNTITLTAGTRYYMMEVHHDPSWAGADDFAATYKLAADPDPKDGDAPKLTGNAVGFYFDPTGANVNFTTQPTNTSVVEGYAATLYGAAAGSSIYGTTVLYQWQSAPKASSTWTSVANATTATYKTPLLTVADDGTQYRLIASVPPISSTSSVAIVTVAHDTTPPVPIVGAMLDVSDPTVVDVGVAFDEPADSTSVSLPANYSVSSGTISSIQVLTNRFTANSLNPLAMILKQSVLLKVTGLTGGAGTLTIKNVADIHGNVITSVSLPFTVNTTLKWGVVGGNELGGDNGVVPVAANGFDIYSDGIGEWSSYDEATFVYEQVTGDFDKKLRVEYQDGSSEWARAGLIVRDVPNFGVDRNGQTTNGLAGRYQKCFVSPVGATLTGPGTPGAQDYELNRRLLTGGQTDGAVFAGANEVPPYPNAWCRIQRVGQKFSLYRSADGVNWIYLGATTWGVDTPLTMPNSLYVGPEFSPENGNIVAADQGTFLARIRDYGNYVAVFDPQLKVGVDATGKLTITWATGTLVSSPTVQGTYTTVTGATSPYVATPTGGAMFYRVQQ
jgi:hypothetical protein